MVLALGVLEKTHIMTLQVDSKYIDSVASLCNGSLSNIALIQTLWSGYGACFRALLSPQPTSNPPTHDSKIASPLKIVAKCATPPSVMHHPRGWNGLTGHKRKLSSFANENSFYRHLQPYTNSSCIVPKCIAEKRFGENTVLVMEDLASLGFTETTDTLSIEQAHVVLRWLGEFHAQFLGSKSQIAHQKINVWDEGSYWHLGTRQDEYNAMAQSPLKSAAHKIAHALSSASYQTLIHGDAKVANFCFTQQYDACAGIDFQYVGFGVGVKDVAYFLGSALSTDDQKHYTQACLTVYFDALKDAYLSRVAKASKTSSNTSRLSYLPPSSHICIDSVIVQWHELYSFACADFHRFLSGWSPQHWKIDEQLQIQTKKTLSML